MNETPMHLGADGKLIPAPPLNTCQVCGAPIAPEADAQDYCDACNPDTPIQVMDDPNDGPIPADLLPRGVRVAAAVEEPNLGAWVDAQRGRPRTAAEAPHVSDEGPEDAPHGDYAVLGSARRIFEAVAARRIANNQGTNWKAAAGQALAAARAFEDAARGD